MWGVSVLGFDWAEDVDERFAALARRVGENRSDLDILLVQEAWKDGARRAFLDDREVASQFPYRIDAVEHPGGSGLVLLSALPIEETRFLRFESQGNCWKFWEADCIGGKGVLAARIRFGGQPIWVANTHLIACYSASLEPGQSCDESDDNGEYRAAQLKELLVFLEPFSKQTPILVGGDFNFRRTSRYYRSMSRRGAATRPDEAVSETKRGGSVGWEEIGERETVIDRIDYVWSRGSERSRWHARTPAERIMTSEVELISGRTVPLSDHPALVYELCLVDEADASDRCPGLKPDSRLRPRGVPSVSGASLRATGGPG
jgi:endonuclease/exonuclease/phosphatase family metal-dependent hydrolase